MNHWTGLRFASPPPPSPSPTAAKLRATHHYSGVRLRAVAAANGVAGCRARRQCVGRGQLRVGASFAEHGGFAAAHLSVPWCRLPTRYAANGSATAAAGSTPTTADVTGSAQRLGPVLCVVVRKLHAAPLTSVALGVDHGGVGHGGVGHDGASLSQQQQQSGHRSDSASIPGARLHGEPFTVLDPQLLKNKKKISCCFLFK